MAQRRRYLRLHLPGVHWVLCAASHRTPYFGKNGQTRRSDIIQIQDRLLQFLFARPDELPPSVQESLKKSSCIVEAMNPGRFVLGVEVTTAGG